jgi:hypothetical protein
MKALVRVLSEKSKQKVAFNQTINVDMFKSNANLFPTKTIPKHFYGILNKIAPAKHFTNNKCTPSSCSSAQMASRT